MLLLFCGPDPMAPRMATATSKICAATTTGMGFRVAASTGGGHDWGGWGGRGRVRLRRGRVGLDRGRVGHGAFVLTMCVVAHLARLAS